MKVLVVGSGAREHALAWALAPHAAVTCAPGNGGTAPNVAPDDVPAWCAREGIGLVVVGPEGPLVEGLADRLQAARIPVFGPGQAGARLEGSKAWSKDFMRRHRIPTAASETVADVAAADRVLSRWSGGVVVKASGLAAGKGVTLHTTGAEARLRVRELIEDRVLGDAGAEVVLEEWLEGEEISLLALVSGDRWVPLPLACDYKRRDDGDRGPNTGGMGAYAPALVGEELLPRLAREVMAPVMRGLEADRIDYRGVLYVGLMLTPRGPKVLEFNVRFGDPETQVVVPLLDGSWLEVLQAVVEGRLAELPLRWRPEAACGVVVATAAYPTSGTSDVPLPDVDGDEVLVFHAGTRRAHDGRVVSHGGRVLTVVARRPDRDLARAAVYRWLAARNFGQFHYRRDIAAAERLSGELTSTEGMR